ncbi:hypothetical protein Patl1_31998 [Pistacia atlantica]|uniref:Uncharacterized protein n=1 Tax=Pistacia atlantica TaxID=434234 RepID=A0ACC1ARD3_9ROSI|nr:hypothetical protein Patl1_31998 [Pistacia atlantica]
MHGGCIMPLKNHGAPVDSPKRKIGLFGLGWPDRNKGRTNNGEESSNNNPPTRD